MQYTAIFTTISYDLPVDNHATLKVNDMLGGEVTTLVNGPQKAGTHTASFDATGLASGVYLYRSSAGDFVQTRKSVLLK